MSGLHFLTNTASAAEMAAHLRLCDSAFAPALSSRVDIDEYSAKIFARASRFEAWSGDTLVGLVAAYAPGAGDPAAFVTNVSVLPAWKRRGIGRRLLGICIDDARRRGCRHVRLEVAAGRHAAVRLYQGLGFEWSSVPGGPPGGHPLPMHLDLHAPRNKEGEIVKSLDTFRLDMELKGWSAFPAALDPELTARMNHDCLKWVGECNRLQVRNGINASGDNTGHHTLGGCDSLDEFVGLNVLHSFVEFYFQGHPYILHAFNPVAGPPRAATYVHRIHRDARSYLPGTNVKLNMLVMLDDFTLENGATQFLEGSHRLPDRPPEPYFDANHKSVTGTKGTIVLFNSYLWHRGGFNSTDANRVALTVAFTPPFYKPQLDYARMLGPEYGSRLTPLTRQILGYNAMTPASLDEWYQPEPTRMYKSNQG